MCLFFARRIIDGPLDVHPSRPAIVVHYEVEATVISEYGEPMVADRKQARKMYVHTYFYTYRYVTQYVCYAVIVTYNTTTQGLFTVFLLNIWHPFATFR